MELFEIIDSLQGEPFFYVEEGPLKNRLIASYMEGEDAHAEILESELNASLRLVQGAGATAPGFDCRLEANDLQYRIHISAADFTADETGELLERLGAHRSLPLSPAAEPGRRIIRKKRGGGVLGISAAASALGLSHRSLKRLIPCSEVRIGAEGEDRTIQEYYWGRELVGRFETLWRKQQEGRGYNREDLSFIAACCCDGDRRWARDCIVGYLNQRKLSEGDPIA